MIQLNADTYTVYYYFKCFMQYMNAMKTTFKKFS